MKYNSRKFFFMVALSMVISVMISWQEPGDEDGRNLKVLPKDISSDSLERVMDGFMEALNVDCKFCHAPKDPQEPKKLNYSSDANPMKDITRTMLKMTEEMNSKYLKTLNREVKLVSCNTCHRGQTVPEK